MDENISMHRIKHYFSSEGWTTVLSTWEKVVSLGWRCGICKKELDGDQWTAFYGITTDVLVIRRLQNALLGFVELVMSQCNFC